MKAVIHIGTEKTGTQSIQEYLLKNRNKLMDSGYYSAQSGGQRNCRAFVAYCLDNGKDDDFFENRQILSPQEKSEFKRDFEQRFHNEMSSVPEGTHTVIFSSEHFHSRIRTQPEVERVHALLSPYFDEFKIICYLREQSACCASSYSTTIKSGYVTSLNEFFKNCVPTNSYYNYNMMLSLWEKTFGIHSLDVSIFEPNRFLNRFLNRNLLDDFIAKISPELVGTLNSNLPQKNKSLSRTGEVMSKMVSRLFLKRTGSGRTSILRKSLQKFFSRKLTGKGAQPSPELRQKIYADFQDSNEVLRKKFFPDQKHLFPPPSSKE